MKIFNRENRYERIVQKIKQLIPKYEQLDDETLQEQTVLFRESLAQGKTATPYITRRLCSHMCSFRACFEYATV